MKYVRVNFSCDAMLAPEHTCAAAMHDGDSQAMAAKRYVIFNKPRGVLTAKKRDPSNLALPTVTETLSAAGLQSAVQLSPVGRLDVESEGLLLLTDDGKLTTSMIDPSFGCRKTYLAVAQGYGRPSNRLRLLPEVCQTCVQDGVLLRPDSSAPYVATPVEMVLLSYIEADAALGGGGAMARCLGDVVQQTAESKTSVQEAAAVAEATELHFVRLVLTEGKKHEVRLLLRKLGFATRRLVRLAHGTLHDPQILAQPGAWRDLRAEERDRLLQASHQLRMARCCANGAVDKPTMGVQSAWPPANASLRVIPAQQGLLGLASLGVRQPQVRGDGPVMDWHHSMQHHSMIIGGHSDDNARPRAQHLTLHFDHGVALCTCQ